MRLGLYIRTCTKVVHRTIRVAVDDFSRCPGSYSFHASALNLPDSLRSTRGVIHPYSAVPEAIATNLKGCLNSEVNLSLWHGGQESNLRLQLGLFTLLSVNLANHIFIWLPSCLLTTTVYRSQGWDLNPRPRDYQTKENCCQRLLQVA